MVIVQLKPEDVFRNLLILVPALQDSEHKVVVERISALLKLPASTVASWLQDGITDVRDTEFVLRIVSMARAGLLPDDYDRLSEFLHGCSKHEHFRMQCSPCPLGGEPVLVALRDHDKYLDLEESLEAKTKRYKAVCDE